MLLFVMMLLIISIIACQQAANRDAADKKTDVIEKNPAATGTTGEAAVDAVGNDLNNLDKDQNDLSINEINDTDSGLADVQNI